MKDVKTKPKVIINKKQNKKKQKARRVLYKDEKVLARCQDINKNLCSYIQSIKMYYIFKCYLKYTNKFQQIKPIRLRDIFDINEEDIDNAKFSKN